MTIGRLVSVPTREITQRVLGREPIDRHRKPTLPAIEDVEDGLTSYTETKTRADELDRTDQLIDEIVSELYGLTEIAIVEAAVEQ